MDSGSASGRAPRDGSPTPFASGQSTSISLADPNAVKNPLPHPVLSTTAVEYGRTPAQIIDTKLFT